MVHIDNDNGMFTVSFFRSISLEGKQVTVKKNKVGIVTRVVRLGIMGYGKDLVYVQVEGEKKVKQCKRKDVYVGERPKGEKLRHKEVDFIQKAYCREDLVTTNDRDFVFEKKNIRQLKESLVANLRHLSDLDHKMLPLACVMTFAFARDLIERVPSRFADMRSSIVGKAKLVNQFRKATNGDGLFIDLLKCGKELVELSETVFSIMNAHVANTNNQISNRHYIQEQLDPKRFDFRQDAPNVPSVFQLLGHEAISKNLMSDMYDDLLPLETNDRVTTRKTLDGCKQDGPGTVVAIHRFKWDSGKKDWDLMVLGDPVVRGKHRYLIVKDKQYEFPSFQSGVIPMKFREKANKKSRK